MKQLKKGLRGLALGVLASSLLAALPAWAVDPFTLRDIRVEGLQRVEPGTVFASLPFRIGDQYSDDKGSTAIRSLFGLGLFSDIRLQINGDVLVVIVEERPTVADVSFSGMKEFDDEVLIKALRDIGLTEGRPFDKALADRAEQELKRQYINKSLYGAEVVTTVTPVAKHDRALRKSAGSWLATGTGAVRACRCGCRWRVRPARGRRSARSRRVETPG